MRQPELPRPKGANQFRPKARLCMAFMLGALLALPAFSSALANSIRIVSGARIELSEVLPDAPEDLRGLDLGPAPSPGTTRTLSAQQIIRQLRAAGFDAQGLDIPKVTQVRSPGRTLSGDELAHLIEPLLAKELPEGVTLVKVLVSSTLTLSPDATFGDLLLPKLPKRIGTVKTTLSVELLREGEVTHRLPVTVLLNLSERATQHDAPKGSSVTLIVRRANAMVTALASPLVNVDIGETAAFRVQKTGRVLRARLVSSRQAEVLEAP